jgi:hypothetical protein
MKDRRKELESKFSLDERVLLSIATLKAPTRTECAAKLRFPAILHYVSFIFSPQEVLVGSA